MDKFFESEPIHFRTPGGSTLCRWAGGQGLPLLFVHGVPGIASIWDEVVRPHIGRRPVATLELPWHETFVDEKAPVMGYVSKAVLEALDALCWAKCLAVGHSFGCGALLLTGLVAPTRFAAQLLVGPHGDQSPADRARWLGFASLMTGEGTLPADVVQIALGLWYTKAFRTERLDVVSAMERTLEQCHAPVFVRWLRGFAEFPDLAGRLEDYRVPVTAVLMDDDNATPIAAAAPYLSATHATVVHLPGGHFPMHEQAEGFAAALRAFVEEQDRDG